jgi:hypothetical protein
MSSSTSVAIVLVGARGVMAGVGGVMAGVERGCPMLPSGCRKWHQLMRQSWPCRHTISARGRRLCSRDLSFDRCVRRTVRNSPCDIITRRCVTVATRAATRRYARMIRLRWTARVVPHRRRSCTMPSVAEEDTFIWAPPWEGPHLPAVNMSCPYGNSCDDDCLRFLWREGVVCNVCPLPPVLPNARNE